MKKRPEATQTLRAGCSKADPQTNTQTDRGDYNTLRSLARSIINKYIKESNSSRNLPPRVIVSRQIRFVGHVMKKNQLEAVALTGMIEGKEKRSWTGNQLRVEINGTATKF